MRKKVFVHLESGRGYSRDLLRGIYDYNNSVSQWDIIFEPAYFLKTNRLKNNLSIIHAVKPDGCILEFTDNVGQLLQLGIPVIQVTSVNTHSDTPYVKGNYAADGRIASEYFRRKGFKNLGFFGIEKLEWSVARGNSFRDYAHARGASFDSYHLKGNERDILSHNFEELITWLKGLPKPVGILCCNDDFGQILINACSMGGIRVPHEVAVLGIDNDELICNITYPNLSSIARNHKNTAARICETLQEMMDGNPPPRRVIETEATEVIERASTDTIACADSMVSKAISYISANLDKPLTAAQVSEATGATLKTLTRKFRLITGCSVHEEIQQRKLQRFKQLLKEDNSIKKISFELGFQDQSHVSRWFTNLEGISPMEWKRKFAD